MLPESAWFFVVAFDSSAQVVVPETQATPDNRAAAAKAHRPAHAPAGGTAMSTGLAAARAIFERAPNAIRQAVFLTDGKNESESAGNVAAQLQACEGVLPVRLLGRRHRLARRRGAADRAGAARQGVAHPGRRRASTRRSAAAIEKASSKALKDVRLRLWTPQGANIAFVKQANPTLEDLTPRARVVTPQVREYMTGAWGAGESRDFHVGIDVQGGQRRRGDARGAAEHRVARVGGRRAGPRRRRSPPRRASSRPGRRTTRFRRASTGTSRTTRARASSPRPSSRGSICASRATRPRRRSCSGRAVKIAHESGNAEMTQRLAKVVEVVDVATGTVRLKRDVSKAATMDSSSSRGRPSA